MSTDRYVFPASFAQSRLWFLQQLEPASTSYNEATAFWLSGCLDVLALERSLATIVERHEVLRTTFRLVDGEPVQLVASHLPVPLAKTDGSNVPDADRQNEVQRLIQEEVAQPFDLERGPLLRARLVRLTPEDHALIFVIHHIVFDGWSAGVLWRELSECYRAFSVGDDPRLPELRVQYADYAVWQRELLRGEPLERQLGYWRRQLAGAPPVLELPTDFRRPPVPSSRGATERLSLSKHLLEQLQTLGHQEGATLFMTLLAGFQLLLSRYSGQDDIVVGTPIAGRTRSELEHLVGFFVNSLALRTDLSGDPTFRELLRRVRDVALAAYAHQDIPFERVVEELHPGRLADRNPFFQVMFALQNAPRSGLRLPGIRPRRISAPTATSKFDLTLHVHQISEGLTARLEYRTDLFRPATMAGMLGHLQTLLEAVAADPDRRLSSLSFLGPDERHQVVVEWNQTQRSFPADQAVHQLFEIEAARQPAAPAVEYGSQGLTYGELNRRANRLARYLRRQGVGPEVRVGVALEQSLEWIVALLAVLKAGGAYLPLDTRYPPERLGFMLKDAGVRVLVGRTETLRGIGVGTYSVVLLDQDDAGIESESADNLENLASAETLAYVMYTSGSTGQPKGIVVPHRAINRLVRNSDYVQLTSRDRVAQVSNPAFDAATFEVWGALLNGGRVVLISSDVVLSASALSAAIRERRISAMFLTTALFNQLSAAQPRMFETVGHLLFGGEAADPRRVREVLAEGPPEHLLHVYGPTEATTFATWHEVREVPETAETVPIGKPIANTTAYVLDQWMMPVPKGVPGELYLGGPGLARGYLDRPGFTAERFVPDPFGPAEGGRLYRTGDLVRFRSDGALEFLGRLDSQVKLHGFRIEPGEVEAVLAGHPEIRECAVVVRDDLPGGRGLVGYLAARTSNGRGDPAAGLIPEVRSYLQSRLPKYMVPSAFVVLEALPLSPNGKIARGALPQPRLAPADTAAARVPPTTGTEKAVAELWQELLGIDRIGLDDNFFELGGHSLLAVRLFAEIDKTFGRTLPVSTLFQAPTVRRLAELLSHPASRSLGDGLVVLQSGRQGPPLFLVHLVDGQLIMYRELVARLGEDLPIYGFELTADSASGPVLTTFEELAAKYVQQMRRTQPVGPYHLCGFCWAGELTFEMARQLVAGGEEVAFLALIDSRCRRVGRTPYYRKLVWRARKYWRLATQNVRRLAALEHAAIPAFLQKRAENITMRLVGVRAYRWSLQLGRPVLPLLRDPARALEQAARCYQPSPYPRRVTLFRVRPPGSPASAGGTMGWSQVAMGGVEVQDVPGEHLTMMQEPHVEELALRLRDCLDRARAGSR